MIKIHQKLQKSRKGR